ncbi:photosystem I reaction center subunit N [Wolffia australiana]
MMLKVISASPAPATGGDSAPRITRTGIDVSRRSALSFLLASTPFLSDVGDSQRALLQKYMEKSKANKEKNDKERLDSYYRRNYKDYFELVEGSNQGKPEESLTESEKEIRRWLDKNRSSS